ncbi:ceramide kinase isoform X2 [Eubalaena glacialis]|uniref:ceramide kinase isoform X2 n=1 Tax=Eubalaena glacialis TaxID=27606 RepID=UPI002A5A1002|nr:ceramide kinase isoform X2 [Eubalaena glacialis]
MGAAEPLRSVLWVKQQRCAVSLDPARALLRWWRSPGPEAGAPGADACSVPISEIITVEETDVNGKHYTSGKWQKMEKPYAFTVHRVRRARRHRWRWAQVTFWCPEEQLCHLWLQTLRELLEKLTSRPKHLLVFINPFGGKGQGKRIYERKVAPLFTLASITTEIIVTEHANHAKESLYELNIDKYDGVDRLCVLLNGWHERRGDLGSAHRRGGLAGHGRVLCASQQHAAAVLGVPAGLRLLRGHHRGQREEAVDGSRQIRLLRFEDLPLPSLLRRDSVLPASTAHGGLPEGQETLPGGRRPLPVISGRLPARLGCNGFNVASAMLLPASEEVEEWKVVCGQFLAINATNMSCACPRSPQGLSPAAHLGDGSSDLILIRKCSRFNFLRFLVRHTNQGDQFDFTFVEVYRVKKFQFVPKPAEDEDGSVRGRGKKRLGQLCSDRPPCCCAVSSSAWNCDGEVLSSPAIEVRVHCQLVRLFARGIEENSKQESQR